MVKTKLILIRHAEALGNSKKIFQGRQDEDVSEKGALQLEMLSLRCRNMTADAVYTSSLTRARTTADAVNRYLKLPVIVDDDIVEISGGAFENKTWAELPELYPEIMHKWSYAPWDFAPPNGESMRQLYDRAYKAIIDIVKENIGKTVFVVTHGCLLRTLICKLKYDDIKCLNKVKWSDNTALYTIEFDEQLNGTILVENDSSHLPEELSSRSNQVWHKPYEE